MILSYEGLIIRRCGTAVLFKRIYGKPKLIVNIAGSIPVSSSLGLGMDSNRTIILFSSIRFAAADQICSTFPIAFLP
jgi:hypothetical protein